MGWKYIVLQRRMGDLLVEFPIIFPDKLVHADVAQVATFLPPLNGRDRLGGSALQDVKVVSAGKIEHLETMGLGGNSETLKISSRRGDALLIRGYSYKHGIVEKQ